MQVRMFNKCEETFIIFLFSANMSQLVRGLMDGE